VEAALYWVIPFEITIEFVLRLCGALYDGTVYKRGTAFGF
jgi:hypothetical protein